MISIVIPVYKTEKYIQRCILSLINQTSKKFEVVLVDDGGGDNSIEIAKKMLKDEGLNYIVCSEEDENGQVINKGLACARNLGIQYATKDWILCVDSDDFIHPMTIEVLTKEIEENTNSQVYIFDYKNVVDEFKLENCTVNDNSNYSTALIDRDVLIKLFFERRMRVVVPTILVNKQFLVKNDIKFPTDSRFSEDQIYLWKLFLYIQTAVHINKIMYFYVHREESIMTSSSLAKILSGYESGWSEFKKFDSKIIDFGRKLSLKKIMARWVLGITHSSAMVLNYQDYCVLLEQMKYREIIPELLFYPEIKIALSSFLLLINKRLYFLIARKSLKNYCNVDRE